VAGGRGSIRLRSQAGWGQSRLVEPSGSERAGGACPVRRSGTPSVCSHR
jgi:hypothetical protein